MAKQTLIFDQIIIDTFVVKKTTEILPFGFMNSFYQIISKI